MSERFSAWVPPPPRIPGLPPALVDVPTWTQERPDRADWWRWREAVLAHRERLAALLAQKPHLWAEELDRCREFGAKYTTTMHYQVYENRTDSKFGQGYLPFVLQPFQVSVHDFLDLPPHERITKVIKKPREVGVTTASVARSLFKWSFEPIFDQTYLSATEDDVDKKDLKDSILVKFDMMLAGCPNPLLPAVAHDFNPWARYPRWRKHLSITNPASGASVNGHATTLGALRGGRQTEVILDEAAFWIVPMGDTLNSVLGATHNAVVMSSDSEEVSMEFTTLVESTSSSHPDSLLVIEAWQHPLWTPEQHAADERRYWAIGEHGKAGFLRERMGIAAEGVHTRKYPEASDVPLDGLPIDPSKPVYCWHDPGRDGDYAIILAQLRGSGHLDLCYGWKAKQSQQASYSAEMIGPLLVGIVPSGRGYPYTDRDIAFAEVMERCMTVLHFGDPFGDQRGASEGWYKEEDKAAQRFSDGKRRIFVRTRLLHPELLPAGARDVRRLPVREEAAKRWLRKTRCANHPYAVEVIVAIRALTMQRVPRNRPRVSEPWQAYHDSDPTHYAQAYEFGVVHLDYQVSGRDAIESQTRTGVAYANPHGRSAPDPTVPLVGTVPTVRR